MNTPNYLMYTKSHEWVRVEEDRAYLGITDYAQHHLGDIVFVELPEVDSEVVVDDSIAVVESVKAVASVFTPVSGTILEVNEELESSPELLNDDPYENWITVISINDPSELDGLMNADQYEEFCAQLDE